MSSTESETDFWKDAALRKAWDDIVPGEPRKTIPYILTLEAIHKYCRSVGEDHPLYFDEAYARTTSYGGLIAPPSIHILLMFACTPADDWMRSPGTINVGQSWSYNIPARPGDPRAEGSRARQVRQKDRLFVGARQRVLQSAGPGHLLGPRLDHPAVCVGSKQ